MSFLMVPHSLNLDFQVFVFGKLFRGFDWGAGVEGYSHVNEKAGFILLVLQHNVRPISCHGPVSVSFSMTVLGSCSYHRSFTSMPNSLQIFRCMCAAALLWRWVYSVLASSGQPDSLHFGSTSGFLRMLCWYQRVGRLWSWAATIRLSVSALRPAAFSHLWVLSWSTSACFTRCG